MKSVLKLFVLVALVCLCTGEEEKKERYSSFECTSYDEAHPEDLAMRNCILRDVVIASEKGQPIFLFYAREGQETPLLSKDSDKGHIVEMAPRQYASVKIVHSALPEDLEPMTETAVIMTAQSNNFAQFVFDTFYSMYWMLSRTGDINQTSGLVNDPNAISIVEVGRPNDYTKIAQGSITMKAVAPLRYLKGVLYSRVVVGPAGHQILAHVKGNSKTVEPDAKLLEQYRNFFLKVAKIKEEDFEETRIVVSQRFTNQKLLNTEDFLSGLAKIGNVQVAFLSQLPIKSQIDIVGNSGVFISTHSDDLAYMLFLRSNAIVMELFPFGLKTDLYKKLAELFGLRYMAWYNTDRSKTVFDPKILDKYPLTAEQKKAITDADHYDASMPSGALAYWENQDTTVAIDDVVNILQPNLPPKPTKTEEEKHDQEEL